MTQHNQTTDLHVIFGAGPVGQAIMDELRAQGRPVRIISRRGLPGAPAGVEVLRGDVTNHDFARTAARGAAVVYSAINAPYTDWPRQFPPLQQGVLAAATAAQAKLVVMENMYGYGDTQGRPLTEDLPLAATYDKARTRIAMHQELLAAHQAGRVRVAVGRASDFYGPRVLEGTPGDRVFIPALRGGTLQALGRLDMPHTYTYMPDIGKALVLLGQREEALGQAWHVPSAPAATMQQVIDQVLALTGQKVKIQLAGRGTLRLLGLFMPIMRELQKTLYQFDAPFIVDSSKFERAFGLHATPLAQGLATTLDWYRGHLAAAGPQPARA
jgi:nucleoside-diphosphate-sugar epimerase